MVALQPGPGTAAADAAGSFGRISRPRRSAEEAVRGSQNGDGRKARGAATARRSVDEGQGLCEHKGERKGGRIIALQPGPGQHETAAPRSTGSTDAIATRTRDAEGASEERDDGKTSTAHRSD